MSDAPPKKRCPNCAWAIGVADALELPQEESWILTIIAEHVDPNLYLHATMAELSRLTRIKPATLSKHVKSLAERKVSGKHIIEMARSRDGYHYTLLRPAEAHSKPTARAQMPYDVPDQELQNLQLPGEPVSHPELQNLCIPPPPNSKICDSRTSNFAIPSNEESLKESLKEERSSLRSQRAPALAREKDPPGWERWANEYPPSRGGLAPARLAYAQALADGATPQELLEGLQRYPFGNDDARWNPAPAKWLRDECWKGKAATGAFNGDRLRVSSVEQLRREWELSTFLTPDIEPEVKSFLLGDGS